MRTCAGCSRIGDDLRDKEKHPDLGCPADDLDGSEMRKRDRGARWNLGIRLLHWLTVVVLAARVGIAFGLMGGPGMTTMLRLPLHMSLGITIFGMILLRLGWRAFIRAPLRQLSPSLRRLSIFVHASLYAFILVIVITGWMAYRPMPLMPGAHLFGSIPAPLAPNVAGISVRDFAMIHQGLVWALLALVGLHVLAALTHAAILRDGILSGMLFGRSKTPTRQME